MSNSSPAPYRLYDQERSEGIAVVRGTLFALGISLLAWAGVAGVLVGVLAVMR